MLLRDTNNGYGLVSRFLHWGMALAIVAMFVLGVWMRTLDYYNPYYTLAPDIHRGVGIILLILLVARFAWRLISPKPDDSELTRFEAVASHIVHWGFYPLLFALMISGYLISTADGRPINVFGLFNVPSVYARAGLEDQAGYVHMLIAYVTMVIAAFHAIGAFKHHFVDHSHILTRMWSGPSDTTSQPTEHKR
jgi:cytochrome b561